MNVGTGQDVPQRDADDLAVLANGRTLGDGAHGDLVARRDVINRGDDTIDHLHERPAAEVLTDKPYVIHALQRNQRDGDIGRHRCGHPRSSQCANMPNQQS